MSPQDTAAAARHARASTQIKLSPSTEGSIVVLISNRWHLLHLLHVKTMCACRYEHAENVRQHTHLFLKSPHSEQMSGNSL